MTMERPSLRLVYSRPSIAPSVPSSALSPLEQQREAAEWERTLTAHPEWATALQQLREAVETERRIHAPVDAPPNCTTDEPR